MPLLNLLTLKQTMILRIGRNLLNHLIFFYQNIAIAILDIKKRKKNFHARYSAKKRQYKYIIINRISSLSLEKNRAWNIRKKLNISKMKSGLKLLKGKKDFSLWCTLSIYNPLKLLIKASL